MWNSRSIYKVIDVLTRHVFTTPSVRFDEHSFPGLPSNSVNPNLFPYRSWFPQDDDKNRSIEFWNQIQSETESPSAKRTRSSTKSLNQTHQIQSENDFPPSKRTRSSKGAPTSTSYVADTEGTTGPKSLLGAESHLGGPRGSPWL